MSFLFDGKTENKRRKNQIEDTYGALGAESRATNCGVLCFVRTLTIVSINNRAFGSGSSNAFFRAVGTLFSRRLDRNFVRLSFRTVCLKC